ncbi:hypothetical protein [Chryseobacterium sp. MEBOG07]|uniref:hypothetical protein n=1 Tax=Chryseobacterium sp. MEBOG07 TaxID=2879939 RepID=UPI001F46B543|nr:hypothetical protein [Chryseobacterium sp. MEBOG07]UKB81016.1 hypothetical protein LF886_08520 [Chryseobacterium sp. MEBOG07]
MNNQNNTDSETVIPFIIVQPGYATGDMFAIAATLINNERYHVLISTTVDKDGNVKDPYDNSKSIIEFYRNSGIDESRIHTLDVEEVRSPGLASKLKKEAIRLLKPYGISTGEIIKNHYKPVGEGTQYIAKNFSEAMRNQLKDAWEINGSQNDAIKIWLEEQGIPTSGNNLLILWSRFSGKGGDIHIEHDTSYWGIKQIVHRVADMYDAVIITGDKGYLKERAKKYDETANEINGGSQPKKVFNITEFWKGDSPALEAWGGNTRLGQFKLYDYFQEHFKNVKHLGFRSGNLEVMAMLGYQVRYMEEKGSESGGRMTTWFDSGHGETALGGKATGYERLVLAEPPTRSGKYIQYQIQEINRETQERKEPLEQKIKGLENSMETTDIQIIKDLKKDVKKIDDEGEAQKKRYAGPEMAPSRKDKISPTPISKKEKENFTEGFSEFDMKIILSYLQPSDWVERETGYQRYISQRDKSYERLLESSEKTY